MGVGPIPGGDDDRATAPVVGNLLLVAVVVVVGSLVVVLSFSILGLAPTDDSLVGQSTVDIEETPQGSVLIPEQMGEPVLVKVNGKPVATVDPDQVGERVFVPTAPGDEITVVSFDDRRQVILRETVSQGEAGDFIAYYTFDTGSGDTAADRSANDNDGDITGATWDRVNGERCLRFDGTDDYVTVPQLNTPGTVDVSEFTVAVEYTMTGHPDRSPGREDYRDIQQLVEHRFSGGNFEWFVETTAAETDPYGLQYAVEYPGATAVSDEEYAVGEERVVVGTYDGAQATVYVDGSRVDTAPHGDDVEMGKLRIGRDFESDIQHFEGCISELRLYYSAFGDAEVRTLTTAID